jgi:TolB-like protein
MDSQRAVVRRLAKLSAALLVGLIAVAALPGWWLKGRSPTPPQGPAQGAPGAQGDLAARIDAALRRAAVSGALPRRPVAQPPSVAVMPFTAPAADEELVAVADSMCEAVTGHLGRGDLPAASACQSVRMARQFGIDQPQSARLLGVRYVLTGALEREGDAVSASARMSEAGGAEVWQHRARYQRSDLPALALHLVQRISNQRAGGNAEVSPDDFAAAPSGEAYLLYLQASYERRRGGLAAAQRARELLDRSLALAPDYVPAVFDSVALNSNLVALGVGSGAAVDAQVQAAAAQLARIAPDHPLTAGIGSSAAVATRHWQRAIELLERAAERHPHDARLQHTRAGVLLMAGYLGRGRDAALRSAFIEPLAASVHERLAGAASLLGDNEAMRESAALTRELGWPSAAAPFEAWFALRRGDAAQSELHWRELLASAKLPQDWVGPVMRAHLDPAQRGAALAAIDAVPAEMRSRMNHHFLAYALAGETDRAMEALKRLSDRAATMWVSDLWLPELAALRRHADFVPYLREAGLLALWEAQGAPERCRRDAAGAWRCE